jgi:hypothetical protein
LDFEENAAVKNIHQLYIHIFMVILDVWKFSMGSNTVEENCVTIIATKMRAGGKSRNITAVKMFENACECVLNMRMLM